MDRRSLLSRLLTAIGLSSVAAEAKVLEAEPKPLRDGIDIDALCGSPGCGRRGRTVVVPPGFDASELIENSGPDDIFLFPPGEYPCRVRS